MTKLSDIWRNLIAKAPQIDLFGGNDKAPPLPRKTKRKRDQDPNLHKVTKTITNKQGKSYTQTYYEVEDKPNQPGLFAAPLGKEAKPQTLFAPPAEAPAAKPKTKPAAKPDPAKPSVSQIDLFGAPPVAAAPPKMNVAPAEPKKVKSIRKKIGVNPDGIEVSVRLKNGKYEVLGRDTKTQLLTRVAMFENEAEADKDAQAYVKQGAQPKATPPLESPAPTVPETATAPDSSTVLPRTSQHTQDGKNVALLLTKLGLGQRVLEGQDFHVRVNNGAYTPLVIERHPYPDGQRLFLTHYNTDPQTGMSDGIDAEAVFHISPAGIVTLAETATQSPVGEKRGKDTAFAQMFTRNLLEQGFGDVPEDKWTGQNAAQQGEPVGTGSSLTDPAMPNVKPQVDTPSQADTDEYAAGEREARQLSMNPPSNMGEDARIDAHGISALAATGQQEFLAGKLHVGDTQDINGRTYRLNENHRWERVSDAVAPLDTDRPKIALGDLSTPTDGWRDMSAKARPIAKQLIDQGYLNDADVLKVINDQPKLVALIDSKVDMSAFDPKPDTGADALAPWRAPSVDEDPTQAGFDHLRDQHELRTPGYKQIRSDYREAQNSVEYGQDASSKIAQLKADVTTFRRLAVQDGVKNVRVSEAAEDLGKMVDSLELRNKANQSVADPAALQGQLTQDLDETKQRLTTVNNALTQLETERQGGSLDSESAKLKSQLLDRQAALESDAQRKQQRVTELADGYLPNAEKVETPEQRDHAARNLEVTNEKLEKVSAALNKIEEDRKQGYLTPQDAHKRSRLEDRESTLESDAVRLQAAIDGYDQRTAQPAQADASATEAPAPTVPDESAPADESVQDVRVGSVAGRMTFNNGIPSAFEDNKNSFTLSPAGINTFKLTKADGTETDRYLRGNYGSYKLLTQKQLDKEKAADSENSELGDLLEPRTTQGTATRATAPLGETRMAYGDDFDLSNVPEFGFDLLAKSTMAQRRNANKLAIDVAQAYLKDGSTPGAEDVRALASYTGDGGVTGDINAHYTPTRLAATMWQKLHKAGFTGGKVLEPSMGAGVFMATAPQSAQMTGVELSRVTAPVAQLLHPDATIHGGKAFEDYNIETPPDEQFDAVISNPPYGLRGWHLGTDKPELKKAEEYFIDTALDRLKDGGVGVFLVNPGPMQSNNSRAFRARLMARADILSVEQLPQATFKDSNSAVPPIVITLKKRPHAEGYALARLVAKHGEDVLAKAGVGNDMILRGEILNDPERIIGSWDGESVTGMYGAYRDIKGDLDDANLKRLADRPLMAAAPFTSVADALKDSDISPDEVQSALLYGQSAGRQGPKEGDISEDGELIFRVGPSGVGRWHRLNDEDPALGEGVALSKELRRFVSLKNTADDPREAEGLRQELNERLNAYLDTHGNPHDNHRLVDAMKHNHFLANLLAGVGKDGQIASYLTRPIANVETGLEHVDVTDPHSIATVLMRRGRLTPRNLAQYWRENGEAKSADHAQDFLEENYALSEGGDWKDPQEFYSGHVLERGDAMKQAAKTAKLRGDFRSAALYDKQAEQFENLIPPKSLEEFTVTPRDLWLPPEVVARFAEEVLDPDNAYTCERRNNVFYLERGSGNYGTNEVEELKQFLNHATKVDAVRGGTDMSREDKQAAREDNIKKAKAKEDAFKEQFQNWLGTSDLREVVEAAYNKTFNSYLEPVEDGSALPLEGWQGPALHRYQNQCVRNLYRTGAGLAGLDVGLGKTHVGTALAETMLQEGRAKNVWITPPKSLFANWRKTLAKDVPHRKVLIIGETWIEPKGKKPGYWRPDDGKDVVKKLVQAAGGDNDIVLITRDWYAKIPVSPDSARKLIEKDVQLQRDFELADAENDSSKKGAKGKGGKKGKNRRDYVKDMEKALADASARMFGDNLKPLYFEDIGVDAVIGDESHSMKNLYSAPTVFGESPKFMGSGGESKRAMDFLWKSQLIREKHNDKNVYLMTATPTKNSPLEVFNMLKHCTDALNQVGVPTLEAFMDRFCEIAPDSYITPDSKVTVGPCVTGFKNLNELRGIMRQFIFRRTGADGDIVEQMGGLPERDDVQHFFEMEPDVAAEYQNLAAQAKEAAANPFKNADKDEHFFSFYAKMKKLTLDPGLHDGKYAEQPNPRFEKAADIASESIGQGGKLVMFMDMGKQAAEDGGDREYLSGLSKDELAFIATNDHGVADADKLSKKDLINTVLSKTDSLTQNAYDRLVDSLVRKGVPREQIAVVTADTAKSSSARDEIKERYNAGDLKVVIGSTGVIGEGFSLQIGTTDMVHLDTPWDPGTYWQRLGRAVRQGNKLAKVKNHLLFATGSFDAQTYGALSGKQGWTQQLWDSTADEVDNTASKDRDELMAMLSGDPNSGATIQAARAKHAEAAKEAGVKSALRRVGDVAKLRQNHALAQQTLAASQAAIEQAQNELATAKTDGDKKKFAGRVRFHTDKVRQYTDRVGKLGKDLQSAVNRAKSDPAMPASALAMLQSGKEFIADDAGNTYVPGGVLKFSPPHLNEQRFRVDELNHIKQTVKLSPFMGGTGYGDKKPFWANLGDLKGATERMDEATPEMEAEGVKNALNSSGAARAYGAQQDLHPDLVQKHFKAVHRAMVEAKPRAAHIVTPDGKTEYREDYNGIVLDPGERFLLNTKGDRKLFADTQPQTINYKQANGLPFPHKYRYDVDTPGYAPDDTHEYAIKAPALSDLWRQLRSAA